MARTVLIAIDGSANSQRAFDFYSNGIRRDDDELFLLNVQTTPNLSSFSMTQPLNFPTEEWYKEIQKEILASQKVVQEYEISCEMKKMAKHSLVATGDPGETIIRVAKEKNISLIVIGSRGMNLVRRTFIGSVSDYVIHHANIPVIVVPPQQ